METMYSGIPFSPQTTLSDTIGAGDTVIPVADISAFPAAPNYATIGTDADGETILYSAKTSTSLSGCTRGVEGAAKSWPSGSIIARNHTAKDMESLQKNVEEHDTALREKYSASNPPPYPVTKVAGKTGDVNLTKSDVGLGNVDNVKQYSASNPPPYPVASVNGSTGAVTVKTTKTRTATFAAGSWTTDSTYGGVKQSVSVSGLAASYDVQPVVGLVLTGTSAATDKAARAAFSRVVRFVTGAGYLTAYAPAAPSAGFTVGVNTHE